MGNLIVQVRLCKVNYQSAHATHIIKYRGIDISFIELLFMPRNHCACIRHEIILNTTNAVFLTLTNKMFFPDFYILGVHSLFNVLLYVCFLLHLAVLGPSYCTQVILLFECPLVFCVAGALCHNTDGVRKELIKGCVMAPSVCLVSRRYGLC